MKTCLFRTAAAGCLALSAATTAAQTPAAGPQDRFNFLAERSHLDNGSGNWDAVVARYGRHWSQRQLLEAELTQTRRFGQDDTEVAVSGAVPLSPALTLSGRFSHSPTHRVLAEGSGGLALQYEFRPAWLLHGAYKHTNYTDSDVKQGTVMLEHYFGNWSVLGAVHRSRAFGESVFAYELRGSYYYGDGSSVGLFLADGDEVAQTGPGTTAISSVRSVALVGHHLLGGPWSLRWGAHYVRQGTFYTRSGASLGVQYAF